MHTVIAGFTTFDRMNHDLAIMKDLALSKAEKVFECIRDVVRLREVPADLIA